MQDQLILVFYIDRNTLTQINIRDEYASSIVKYFEKLGQNPAIFFIPTDDGTERIECLNPKYIEDQNEIAKLKKLLSDVEKIFQVENISKRNEIATDQILDYGDQILDDEESEDPLDIEYSDLTEDMRNKIAFYDKKYHEILNESDKTMSFLSTDNNFKKGHLLNHIITDHNMLINKNIYELIEFIGDNSNIFITIFPAFSFNDEIMVVKNKYFNNKEDLINFINDLSNKIAIYTVVPHNWINPDDFMKYTKYNVRYCELTSS